MIPLIIVGAVVLVIVLYVISTHNSLAVKKEKIKNSMGQIAAQIESRWDALTSLIAATEKYTKHESETLENVTKARSSIGKNSTVSEVEKDQQNFDHALSRLLAVAESYPDLKASGVFQSTMKSIEKYEDYVRHARLIYNDTVTMYNSSLITFPSNIVAGMFNFTAEDYFENSPEKTQMPQWREN